MDEIERIYGNFMVWRSRFIPGASGDCKLIHVPMEMVVDRFVLDKKHQKCKEKLLDRWKKTLQADGVTLTDICLKESEWNG